MDDSQNQQQQKSMPRELFERLDSELQEIFTAYAMRAKNPDNYNSHATHGLTAAKTAQALIDLHTKCKPG